MKDRGMIKWQPFDSLIPSKDIINSILINKNKVAKPTLSIDQLENLNELLKECYYNQNIVNIKYFKNNNIYNIKGKIKAIDVNNKIVLINKTLKLHISQILQINT